MLKIFFMVMVMTIATFVQAEGKMAKVTQEIERINSMRESLVTEVQGNVTPQTFKAVCKPVGKELKKLGKNLGLKVRQASLKNRNPNNKPSKLENEILNKMSKDQSILSLWTRSSEGLYYFRRIDVQQACLNCHGSKSSRPEFIKKKYPFDKAFGFKKGDLRGAYSVFLPK